MSLKHFTEFIPWLDIYSSVPSKFRALLLLFILVNTFIPYKFLKTGWQVHLDEEVGGKIKITYWRYKINNFHNYLGIFIFSYLCFFSSLCLDPKDAWTGLLVGADVPVDPLLDQHPCLVLQRHNCLAFQSSPRVVSIGQTTSLPSSSIRVLTKRLSHLVSIGVK